MLGFVIETAVAFFIGLLVGWNLFPQPAVVKALWDKVVSKFKKGGK